MLHARVNFLRYCRRRISYAAARFLATPFLRTTSANDGATGENGGVRSGTDDCGWGGAGHGCGSDCLMQMITARELTTPTGILGRPKRWPPREPLGLDSRGEVIASALSTLMGAGEQASSGAHP